MRGNKKFGSSKENARTGSQPRSTAATTFDNLPIMRMEQETATLPGSGRKLVTYGYEDPYASLGSGLFGFVYSFFDLLGYQAGGAVETVLQPMSDFWTRDAYLNIVMELVSNGISFNQFNEAAANDFYLYLNSWAKAFMALRGLQALVLLHGYNRACDEVARAIWVNRQQIEALLNRLESLPFPSKLKAALDDLCGVYFIDSYGLPPLFSIMSFPGRDLTSQTDIASLLADITTNINGTVGNADSALTIKALVLKYGQPTPIGQKTLNTDPAYYYMHLSQGYQYQDTTSGNTWCAPQLNSPSVPDLPVFIHGGDKGVTPYSFTLLRPTLFSNVSNSLPAVTGPRGALGYLPNSTFGTYIDAYNQLTGVKGAATGAGAGATTAVNLNDFANGTLPWARVAQLETTNGAQVTGDGRILPEWTRFYVPEAVLVDETIRLYRQLLELN